MTWHPGRISLLVPSRGRPDQLAAMWQTATTTARRPQDLELVLYLDLDDPAGPRYTQWLETLDDRQLNVTGPRILLSETWNRLAEVASGEILWHGNDDVAFRSAGWDALVLDAFDQVPDHLLLVHGRDGIHDARMATLGFYHRAWVDLFGVLVPPYFSSDYNDTWNTEVADAVGRRRYLPQVFTDHLHPAVGKAPMDRTHTERLTRHRTDNVDQRYRDLAPVRAEWAAQLQEAIGKAAG